MIIINQKNGVCPLVSIISSDQASGQTPHPAGSFRLTQFGRPRIGCRSPGKIDNGVIARPPPAPGRVMPSQYLINPLVSQPLEILNPNVAKAGGFQSQDAKGAAVVDLLQALGNAGSGALRLSRRVKKMASNRPDPQVHQGNISRMALQLAVCSLSIRFS